MCENVLTSVCVCENMLNMNMCSCCHVHNCLVAKACRSVHFLLSSVNYANNFLYSLVFAAFVHNSFFFPVCSCSIEWAFNFFLKQD